MRVSGNIRYWGVLHFGLPAVRIGTRADWSRCRNWQWESGGAGQKHVYKGNEHKVLKAKSQLFVTSSR